MLKFINQFWRFDTQAQLDEFLDGAAASKDEYQLERAGRAKNGSFYAFGTVIPCREPQEPKTETAQKVPEAAVPEIA